MPYTALFGRYQIPVQGHLFAIEDFCHSIVGAVRGLRDRAAEALDGILHCGISSVDDPPPGQE
jgi:hypothetical protein